MTIKQLLVLMVKLGKITLEQVPEKYRTDVEQKNVGGA